MEYLDNSLVEPIEIRMIRPAKYQVRYGQHNDSEDMANLKASIKEHGLLQPILIRPIQHGFEIVAGHRRFAACKSLRWRFIPSKIRDFSDKQAYEIQLIENIQRKTMDPLEEAEAFQKYVLEFGWGGMRDLAKKIGKSEEYVSHRLQLLKLPSEIRQKITNSNLSVSKALELTTLEDPVRKEFADKIVSGNMTVRQIRQMKNSYATESVSMAAQNSMKATRIVKKCNLALKITLSRLDDLVEDAHSVPKKDRAELVEFLMNLRLKTHAMIDETIQYKKNLAKE